MVDTFLYLESQVAHAFEMPFNNILALFWCLRRVELKEAVVPGPLGLRAGAASEWTNE